MRIIKYFIRMNLRSFFVKAVVPDPTLELEEDLCILILCVRKLLQCSFLKY